MIDIELEILPKMKLQLHQLKPGYLDKFLSVSDIEATKMKFESELYDKSFAADLTEDMVKPMIELILAVSGMGLYNHMFNDTLAATVLVNCKKLVNSHLESAFDAVSLIWYDKSLVREVIAGDVVEMIINDKSFWYMYDNESPYIGLDGIK